MCMPYTDSIHVRLRDFRAAVGPVVKNSPEFSGHLLFLPGDLQMCSRGSSCFQSQVNSVST